MNELLSFKPVGPKFFVVAIPPNVMHVQNVSREFPWQTNKMSQEEDQNLYAFFSNVHHAPASFSHLAASIIAMVHHCQLSCLNERVLRPHLQEKRALTVVELDSGVEHGSAVQSRRPSAHWRRSDSKQSNNKDY